MINPIEFYYDFVSPYSYIAHKRIINIKQTKKINFLYKPILLGGLHNLLNITAPAFTKSKNKYLVKDCEMITKKLNINFEFNKNFPINSLQLMRGVLVINDAIKENFIDLFFNAYWSKNINLSDQNEIEKLLIQIKVDPIDFFQKVKDTKIKDRLKSLTQEAFKKEIFGAPTFVVNNKIFWGQDRLEYAVDEYEKIK